MPFKRIVRLFFQLLSCLNSMICLYRIDVQNGRHFSGHSIIPISCSNHRNGLSINNLSAPGNNFLLLA